MKEQTIKIRVGFPGTRMEVSWYGRADGYYSRPIEKDTRKAAVANVLETVIYGRQS